jgi:DNA polymerase
VTKLHIDFESRSPVDLRASGAHKYARDPRTEILCVALARGKNVPILFKARDIGENNGGCGDQLTRAALRDDIIMVAHGVHFEYPMWNYCLTRMFPRIPRIAAPSRWSCTLARAAAVGFPISLEKAGLAAGLKVQKDLEGKAALLKICKPVGFDALGDPIYTEDRDLYERVYRYCPVDVVVEQGLDVVLPELTDGERAVFEADLTINDRGVAVDLEVARKAEAIAAQLTTKLNAQLNVLTGGAVEKATRVAGIKNYLKAVHGMEPESLDKTAVTAILEDPNTPRAVAEILSIRRQVGKSSTAKFTATQDAACADGRVRGALQYHAAHTGRWGGRLIQPQNYPKGFKDVPAEEQEPRQAEAIDLILRGDADAFAARYGAESMETLSAILRGTIVAPAGKVLVGADFNAIEARVLFWLAGDMSALGTYHRGESPYVDMARYIFNNPAVTKKSHPDEYDLGKRAILGCGYGMGAPKFKDTVRIQANKDIPLELAERAVKAYREKYRSVVQMWYATERAAVNAVMNRGTVQLACGGRVLLGMSAKYPDFLVAKLPSGRCLWYYKPRISVVPTPWGEGEKQELSYLAAVDPQNRGKCLEYDAVTELGRLKTYGGSLVENITQAIARDLMANAMLNVGAVGFQVVLTVHDELLAEVSAVIQKYDGFKIDPEFRNPPASMMLNGFIEKMCTLPAWAKGLPVAAEGRVGQRYCK